MDTFMQYVEFLQGQKYDVIYLTPPHTLLLLLLFLTKPVSVQQVSLLNTDLHKHVSDTFKQWLSYCAFTALLKDLKAHFWLTTKNPAEILLTSDPTQHRSSFDLASLQTGNCCHLKCWSGCTDSSFPFPLRATGTPPPSTSDFTPVCSTLTITMKGYC